MNEMTWGLTKDNVINIDINIIFLISRGGQMNGLRDNYFYY